MTRAPLGPIVCYTLDLEPDFGGRLPTHSSLEELSRFEALVRTYRLNLTTFATGSLFRSHPAVVRRLLDLGSEIEVHSYSHDTHAPDHAAEIAKAHAAYREFFGRPPIGYRAPQGILPARGFRALQAHDFRYDSSIFPTWMPGRYNNLRFPTQPFYYRDYELIEMPFSVFPVIRVPLAMGYLQPLGTTLTRLMFRAMPAPPIVVFDFHLWNLYPPRDTARLTAAERLVFARNLDRGFEILESCVRALQARGYQSLHMGDLHARLRERHRQGALPVYGR